MRERLWRHVRFEVAGDGNQDVNPRRHPLALPPDLASEAFCERGFSKICVGWVRWLFCRLAERLTQVR